MSREEHYTLEKLNKTCFICKCQLTEENVYRWDYYGTKPSLIRLDCQGFAWCIPCTEEFDLIDWDEVHNS